MWRRFRGLVFIVVSVVGGLWLANELIAPKAGIRVSREDAPVRKLPANARNVTYYVRQPASYYEFDTDEAGFEEWAAGWGLAWQRIEGLRFVRVWDHVSGKLGEVELADTVGYAWSHLDAGWSITYDRSTGRAYCSGHYR
ncbi:MAG: hypothetical protein ACRC8S_00730 [Fimbriiglobus sp.]